MSIATAATVAQDSAAIALALELGLNVQLDAIGDGTARLILWDDEGTGQRMTLLDERGAAVEPQPAGYLAGYVPADEVLAGWAIVHVGDGGTIHTASGACWGRHTGAYDSTAAWEAVGAYVAFRDRLGLGLARA